MVITNDLDLNVAQISLTFRNGKLNLRFKSIVTASSATPIKALGVHYTYDLKLLHEKNFIERLDSVKKLINIWSSRGLSIYGKVTIIKSLIIPKLVYISSLLPTPKEIIQELNRLLFKFLWK